MLNRLKFVQGAVSRKNFVPELTHFKIENGTIRSYNGTISLCTPIQLDIDCCPKAEPFVKAIQNCKDIVSLSMTSAGRLSIKSGPFKAFVATISEETAHVLPEGTKFDVDGECVLKACKILWGFIGDDASRTWSNGILFSGASAFATNNVALVQYWLGTEFPTPCNVPRAAIKEIIRINEPPTSIQVGDSSITFHFEEGRWLRSQLYATDWPDLLKVLDKPVNPIDLPEKLAEGLETIKPFVDDYGRVYLEPGKITTSPIEGEGATFEIENFEYDALFNLKVLLTMTSIATQIDFTPYPKPCFFFGERLRGAIIGMIK